MVKVARNQSMGSVVVVRIRFGVDDGKLSFRSGFEEETLHCGRRRVGEDYFIRMYVLAGIVRNLLIRLL